MIISPSVNRRFEENVTVLLILMHFKYQFQSALGRLMNVFMELGFASRQEAARQRNIFHWLFLSMKSCSSETCSCVCSAGPCLTQVDWKENTDCVSAEPE